MPALPKTLSVVSFLGRPRSVLAEWLILPVHSSETQVQFTVTRLCARPTETAESQKALDFPMPSLYYDWLRLRP